MSAPGESQHWYHWMISTRNSWRHGDERGFRSRRHRIHSSGDYKHQPPPTEHDGLRAFHRNRSGDAVVIPESLRATVGEALRTKIIKQQFATIIIAVSGMHVHGLSKVPGDRAAVKRIIGTWKQASSHAVRDTLPGSIWSEGSHLVSIEDRDQHVNTFNYILEHVSQGAWVWTYRDED